MAIIAAFPGCGKSYFFENNKGFTVCDSDSSTFDKQYFPQNYIESIKEKKDKFDFLLVSSHKVVRDALMENGLDFILVYPDISLKDEFMQRYRDRGSPQSFIALLDKNFETWVQECEELEVNKIKLTKELPTLSEFIAR